MSFQANEGGWDAAPFRVTLPFTDEVRGTDTEEGALSFGCHGLCEITLSGSRWAVEEDTLPRSPLASEEMGELYGQNDGFLERRLCTLETSDVVPFNIRRLRDDGPRQRAA